MKASRSVGKVSARIKEQFYLIRLVAVPMAVLAILCFVLAALTNGVWQGGLIELGATWLGVLVTVFYVEVILERQEARRWGDVERLITDRVKRTALSRTTTLLGLLPNYPFMTTRVVWGRMRARNYSLPDDWLQFANQYIDDTQAVLAGFIGAHWAWDGMRTTFEGISDEYREVISLFGDKLSPQVFDLVWNAQVSAEDAFNFFTQYMSQMDNIMENGYLEQVGDVRTPLLDNVRTVVRNNVALLTDH